MLIATILRPNIMLNGWEGDKMAVDNHIEKIYSAIEAGRRAAASIDYGPIRTLDTISTEQNRFIADWQTVPDDPTIFLFGLDKWGDPTRKVTK